jgi:hypothetical protein
MPTTTEISDYVTGLSSATLTGAEEVYLATDEKATVSDIANFNSTLKTVTLPIGDWDMVASSTAAVAHGIADYTKIRSVSVMIIPDAATSIIPLNGATLAGVSNGYVGNVQSAIIPLFRVAGGSFDSVLYDSTGFNRGHITLWYEV